jgi:hypothetical protein
MLDEKGIRVALGDLMEPPDFLSRAVPFHSLLARLAAESGTSGDALERELVEWLDQYGGHVVDDRVIFSVDAWKAMWLIELGDRNYIDVHKATKMLAYLDGRELGHLSRAFADALRRSIANHGGKLQYGQAEAADIYEAIDRYRRESGERIVGEALMNVRSDVAHLVKFGTHIGHDSRA